MKRRIFISTGEVSGDLQGGLLIEALWRQAEHLGVDLDILGLGGDRMAQAGARLLGNTSSIGSIGLFESLPYILPTIWIQHRAKRYLKQYPPDLVVMIDYLGPNIGIGSYARNHLPQIPIVYYIAPQEWVWSPSSRNTRRIVRMTDRLLAIFPEEARYYQNWGADTIYVGHPLLDRMQTAPSRLEAREFLGIASEEVAIALLPASRPQELKYLLPVMFQAAQEIQEKLPQVRFWIPLSLEIYRRPLEQAIQHYGLRARLLTHHTQMAIAAADLAITKSGTVNLEIALLNVPQVVMYRVSPLTAWIAEHWLKFSIPYMSPPNLALMQSIVPEFLQHQATPQNITQAAIDLLLNPDRQQQMRDDYARMRQVLGEPGVCDRAAQEILKILVQRQP